MGEKRIVIRFSGKKLIRSDINSKDFVILFDNSLFSNIDKVCSKTGCMDSMIIRVWLVEYAIKLLLNKYC